MNRRSRTNVITLGDAGAPIPVMLGAAGGPVAATTIGSEQSVDHSIGSGDVHIGKLRLWDFDRGPTAALRGPTGPAASTVGSPRDSANTSGAMS
ncbi:MAG: hypothetical protein ABI903_13380 [Actinomycetota bacterium]